MPAGDGQAAEIHSLAVPQPVDSPFVRLHKLNVTADPSDAMALLQLAPRALLQLSLRSCGCDGLVPLFCAIANFELLTQLDLNMVGFASTHVSGEALLLLANLHSLRLLTIDAYATHENCWALTDVDNAGLAQILAGLPHLATFDFLQPSYCNRLCLWAALKSASEHCRYLCHFHVCGRLCLVL
jgi:hypothetical protein